VCACVFVCVCAEAAVGCRGSGVVWEAAGPRQHSKAAAGGDRKRRGGKQVVAEKWVSRACVPSQGLFPFAYIGVGAFQHDSLLHDHVPLLGHLHNALLRSTDGHGPTHRPAHAHTHVVRTQSAGKRASTTKSLTTTKKTKKTRIPAQHLPSSSFSVQNDDPWAAKETDNARGKEHNGLHSAAQTKGRRRGKVWGTECSSDTRHPLGRDGGGGGATAAQRRKERQPAGGITRTTCCTSFTVPNAPSPSTAIDASSVRVMEALPRDRESDQRSPARAHTHTRRLKPTRTELRAASQAN
jgi:hypothetical protein